MLSEGYGEAWRVGILNEACTLRSGLAGEAVKCENEVEDDQVDTKTAGVEAGISDA